MRGARVFLSLQGSGVMSAPSAMHAKLVMLADGVGYANHFSL